MITFLSEARRLYKSEPLWKRIILFVPWVLLLVLGLIVWMVWSSADKAEHVVSGREYEDYKKRQQELEDEKERLKNDVSEIEEERELARMENMEERKKVVDAVNSGRWSYLDHYVNRVRAGAARGEPKD
jgi:predicted negative regulator of RcsB-dependent stress response